VRRRELVAWAALGLLALAVRLVDLADRPPHHDEAVHAHFAHHLLTQGAYRYDPTYHGPLLFYVMAPLFALLGENLFTARLYPAVAGAALAVLPVLLRRRVGAGPAWWTGFVLAISPSFLYYSRFARNDVPVALFTALALVLLLRGRQSDGRSLPWAGVAAALHAISKETFYVTVPLLVLAAVAVGARVGARRTVAALRGWVSRFSLPLGTAVLWFVAIVVTAYTFVFIHPEDAFFPLKAVRYWYEQHRIQRVGGPWFYHFPRLALYEFLILGAAVARVVRRGRRLRPVEVFCLAWGAASLGMYAYLGEKVPWLLTHQVLPFSLLAGAELAWWWSRRGRWFGKGVVALAVALTVWSSLAVTFRYGVITPSDPHAELLVFVQTTPEAAELARRGVELHRAHPDALVAAVSGEAAWPLSWQWRDLSVWWGKPQAGSRPLLCVGDAADARELEALLGNGYTRAIIPLRGWWVESWEGTGVGAVVRWFFTRLAWSPLGATEIVVFQRQGEGAVGKEREP